MLIKGMLIHKKSNDEILIQNLLGVKLMMVLILPRNKFVRGAVVLKRNERIFSSYFRKSCENLAENVIGWLFMYILGKTCSFAW